MNYSTYGLEYFDQEGKHQVFVIKTWPLTIGRNFNHGLVLQNVDVSRNQAMITQNNNSFFITDVGSANGTRVDRQLIQPNSPYPISSGATIEMGKFTMRFVVVNQNQPPQPDPRVNNKTRLASSTPILQIVTPNQSQEIELNGDMFLLGRDSSVCNIVINEGIVSGRHAEIRKIGDSFTIFDLGSQNGLRFEGQKISSKGLNHGDKIEIGAIVSLIYQDLNNQETFIPKNPPQAISLKGKTQLTFGRDPQNDVVIPDLIVSRFHAKLSRLNGSVCFSDLNSSNGSFINGKLVDKPQLLKVGDVVRIGSCRLVFNFDESFAQFNEEANMRLDALRLTKIGSLSKKILDDISLSILPGEFIVIAGVSGGGKSTLLDALNGFRPATSGEVRVNNVDLYKNFDAYRTDLGYVPQKDIVHMELTVEEALNYAARLRMPSDTTRAERKKRVEEVMTELALIERRNLEISKLSGGQLKRVSIGVELITKPSLFFLDEATSGLDPGTETDLMILLRKLAKEQGRTILLITHATDNITECDLVVFLAKGGRLAYLGPPQDAPSYFGVSKFNEIYKKVQDERSSPDQWKKQFEQSPFYQKYVVDRLKNQAPVANKANRVQQRALPTKTKGISGWEQFWILSERNLAILARDRASLILMLAIAPILGVLDLFIWKKNLFDITNGDPGQIIIMLFMTGLIAVMVGSMATMREIVKEADIYKRERAIGLKLLPYILSKVAFCILLAAYQSAVFLFCKQLAVDLPSPLVETYFTIFLATLAGTMMGLFVSAVSPNQNVAPLLTIVLLVPQILFGGGLLSIDTLGKPAQLVNHLSLTKYPFEVMMTLTNFGGTVKDDLCWLKPKSERDNLSESYKKENCDCLGVNIFSRCYFPGLKANYNADAREAIENDEPVKPTAPGDPPTDPSQLSEYKDRVQQYNRDIEAWQEKYSKWKGDREGAIVGGEELLNRFHKSYGKMYNINVKMGYLQLGFLMFCLFVLAIMGQTIKDFKK